MVCRLLAGRNASIPPGGRTLKYLGKNANRCCPRKPAGMASLKKECSKVLLRPRTGTAEKAMPHKENLMRRGRAASFHEKSDDGIGVWTVGRARSGGPPFRIEDDASGCGGGTLGRRVRDGDVVMPSQLGFRSRVCARLPSPGLRVRALAPSSALGDGIGWPPCSCRPTSRAHT